MAVQIDTDELKGCKSYFSWIFEQVSPAVGKHDLEMYEKLCRLLFDTDYIFEMEEDGIRAKDATDNRKNYADSVGEKSGKNEHDIDRIWKSVHGKCSVLELIYAMCVRLDEMVNEGEEGSMVPMFFMILVENIGLFPDSEAPDQVVGERWKARINRFMKREYREDGSDGGLFPLKNWSAEDGKDQRKVSIWYQMNTWLDENLDDDEHFLIEKWAGEGVRFD